ncbi:MAG: peptidase M24 [Anaerovibrio lipolyticus]|nr:peptidase M24 [Anaerovibrio lipolyticus]
MLKRYWWLLLLVLLSVPQLSFASEATYQITESELTQLENNLTELSNLNDRQSKTLIQQQKHLQESEEKLSRAGQESEKLQNQIYSLRKEMIEQENSLETARASLEWFEKEEQAKLNRAKQEKTAAWIIAGLLLCFCIGK